MSRSFKNFIVVFLALFVFVTFIPTLSGVIPDFEDNSTTEAPETTKTPETTEAPESEAPKDTETTSGKVDVPMEVTDWYAFVDSFFLVYSDDIVDINNASTDSVNGSIIKSGETTYPSVTALGVAFCKGWVAVDGFEVSGINVKIYDQGGSQLGEPVSIVLKDADQNTLNAVATLGYGDGTVARKISFGDFTIIDLESLAEEGQTVTVVYEVALAGSDDTVEVISLDVTVSGINPYEETTAAPEVTEAPEETTLVPEETTDQISDT